MKKICVFCLAIICFISSCKKELVDVSSQEIEIKNASSDIIYWDDLPDEYKNAVRVSPDEMVSKKEGLLPVNPHKEDENFNPFNVSTENFSIAIPAGYPIKKAAIGIGKNGYVSYITLWYTTGRTQSILYVVSSGGSMSNPMAVRSFTEGEYIKSFSGRSDNGILKDLTIYTNKGSLRGGSATTGTRFSVSATPGSYIGKFSGNVGNSVSQLKATSYFLPWEKASEIKAKDVSIANNGNAYMTDFDGTLYEMPNNTTSWSRVAGAPIEVQRIAAHKDVLYVSTGQNTIYKRSNGQWSDMNFTNAPQDIAVSDDGTLYAIFEGSYGAKNLACYLTNAWNRLTSGTVLESVAVRDRFYPNVVSASGYVYEMGNYSNGLGNSFGSDAKDITMGYDIWTTTRNGRIRVMLSYNNWKEIEGTGAVRIDGKGTKLMMINTAGDIYKLEY